MIFNTKGSYAGNFGPNRSLTPLHKRPKARTLDILLKKPEIYHNSPDSPKSSPKTSKNQKFFKDFSPESSRMLTKSVDPVRIKGLISNLMNRNLGIRVQDEICTPRNRNISRFYELRGKRDNIKIKRDEIVGFITDPLHYKSEYLSYLFDVGKNVLMEKYIGQNLLKKRKQMKFLNGFNKL
jgi:hypothetical protein